ncbi:MAG: glycosyltransferase family 39 protein, partial [Acidobacteriota bacterium]|nr:glycosyltransferase family 39 protein [Acidobacteriota bacterium]
MKLSGSRLHALLLLAIVLLAYSNSFQSGFVLDNRGLILVDERVHAATASNLGLIFNRTYWWPHGESGLYRPFTTFTYLLNYAILGNGSSPAGYHVFNLLVHLFNVLLLYAIAARLLSERWSAFFVAGLWAAHPVLTEAVTNIAGRADLLAAFGVLAGLLTYLKGRDNPAWFAAAAAATAVGVFSKETGVVIVGVILLYDLISRRRPAWPGVIAVTVPAALMLIQRAHVLAGAQPMEIPFTDNPIPWADFLTGRLTAFAVISKEFALILWPATLSADYSWSQIPLFHGGADWVRALLPLAILSGLFFLYRWNKAALFFFLAGLFWLAPAANILFPTGAIMAERLLYLTAAGIAACVALALLSLPARYARIALAVLIAACAARTWVRNTDWADDASIANASVKTSPASFKTHDLLANVLFASDPTHTNIGRVIAESEKSRAILDTLPDTRKPSGPYRFAANCYMIRNEYPKAEAALLQFIAIEKTAGRAIPPEAYLLLS